MHRTQGFYLTIQKTLPKNLPGSGLRTGTTVVTVTFKNIKTAKSTAKKYRCVVKAAIEEKPVEPEVVKATKITEAKAATAKTVSVTFDGAVDTTSATAIKLTRGTIDAPITVAYASDAKSATLTSATPLAAGTYTLTVGNFAPVNFVVTKQTATKLEITSTTVANKDGAGVGFQVLDQYGDPMTSYTAKKLVVKAYNATKGHDIVENTELSKPYFTLNCATQDVNGKVINALGDEISVVAYLKDNASVSCTQKLTITDIYMESLEFGEPELGSDKRVTIKKTYKLPYTAKTNEGNEATFGKYSTSASKISRTFGDYTFVSSNISALDMGDVSVDKDGNMFFTAGNTAGTAVITAINNKTGSTVSTTIVVNDIPTLSRLDVADASVAWDTASGEVKAEVTAYDQFDEVIDAKDIKNLKFDAYGGDATTALTNMFSSVVRVPGTANIEVEKFSSDGKYLVYKVTGRNTAGQNVVFNFTSAKTGTNGYVTCKSTVEINDRVEPGALTIVAEPDATKEENGTVKVKFSVVDQYQNKVALSVSGSVLKYVATAAGSVKASTYTVEAEYKGAVTGLATATAPATNPTVVAGTDNQVGQFEFKLNSTIDALYKDAQITVKLLDDGDQIDAKKFDVKVIKTVSDYDVMTDKTSYTAGDTVTVNVNAYSNVDGTRRFNRYFNGKHNVEIELTKNGSVVSNTKTRKTIEFKDGVATFTMTAGTKTGVNEKYKYTVTKVDAATVNSSYFNGENEGFTVVENSANKIVVNETTNKLQIVDSQGNELSGAGTSYAQIIVKDETLGKDITNDSSISNNGTITLNDKTAVVTLDAKKNIVTLAGVNYNMGSGFSVTIPGTSVGNNVSLSITVDGCTWKETKVGTATTTYKSDGAAAMATIIPEADADIARFLPAVTGTALTHSVSSINSDTNVHTVSVSSITLNVTTAAIKDNANAVTASAVTGLGTTTVGFGIDTSAESNWKVGDQITVQYVIKLTTSTSTPVTREVAREKTITAVYECTTAGGSAWKVISAS